MFEKLFKLKEHNTDVKTEILAGITVFMTMAYILAVNPNILSATGMNSNGVFIATALSAFVGTLLMALFANYPFALAPGMGLNAYFAYTVVLGMGYSWETALSAVFVEGVIFILLSVTNIRTAIFNAIPLTLKTAVSVGIGMEDNNTIDDINILQATYKAMQQAINNMPIKPQQLLVDAVTIPNIDIPQEPIIKGDAKSISIGAASIVAKVTRDRMMAEYAKTYPMYEFDSNMGYGSKTHIEAIKKYGLCQIHRKSFTGNFV